MKKCFVIKKCKNGSKVIPVSSTYTENKQFAFVMPWGKQTTTGLVYPASSVYLTKEEAEVALINKSGRKMWCVKQRNYSKSLSPPEVFHTEVRLYDSYSYSYIDPETKGVVYPGYEYKVTVFEKERDAWTYAVSLLGSFNTCNYEEERERLKEGLKEALDKLDKEEEAWTAFLANARNKRLKIPRYFLTGKKRSVSSTKRSLRKRSKSKLKVK